MGEHPPRQTYDRPQRIKPAPIRFGLGLMAWTLTSSSPAFATEASTPPVLAPIPSALEQTHTLVEASSEENRGLLKQGLAYRLGLFWGTLAGSGLEAHVGLTAHEQLVFTYLRGRQDLTSHMADGINTQGVHYKHFDMTGQLAVLGYRRFFGNSLYATASLGYRGLHADYGLVAEATQDRLDGDISVQSFVCQIAIGNHWTWGNGFFMAGEWLGAAVPFGSRYFAKTSTGINSELALEEAEDDAIASGRKLARLPSLSLLNLTLGVAF